MTTPRPLPRAALAVRLLGGLLGGLLVSGCGPITTTGRTLWLDSPKDGVLTLEAEDPRTPF